MTHPLFPQAERAFHAGDLPNAAKTLDAILADRPELPPAVLLRALVYARQGDPEKALAGLDRALELSPDDYVALTWRATALLKAGRPEEALATGQKAHRLWPDDADILVGLSHAHLALGDFAGGAEALQKAAKLQPRNPHLQRRLGIARERLGQDEEAARAYRKALALAPNDEEALVRLGRLLMGHGNAVQAIELLERTPVRSAQTHLVLAQAYRAVRDDEPAQRHLQAAIGLDPETVLAAGLWLSEDGRFDEAAAMFQRSIAQRPKQGVAYFGLLKGRKTRDDDRPLLETMEALLETPNLPPAERAALHYGLGKGYDDLREYARAMPHFDEGNRLAHAVHLAGRPYDAAATERNRARIVETFSPEAMARWRHLGSPAHVPIFIIGMIRSGTSLLEQIVASHPDVGGAGEQRFWVNAIPRLLDLDRRTLDEKAFVEARDRYLKVLRGFVPDAPRITDKMPLNFYCAGPIHLAYPEAPILHIRRHPIDTALSIYTTDLSRPPDFAHRKENIVAEYRNYLALMAHWRTVIPEDRLLELRYEDLVADQEAQTRRVLEFCGLAWDARTLEFYRDDRPVSTPSQWQVRQPIYRTSTERWRNYEPWLGPFAELRNAET